MAHTESENRLAPFTLAIAKRPSSRRPPVDLEEAGQAPRLKASGDQVCLVVCRQELVRLCHARLERCPPKIFVNFWPPTPQIF